MACCGGAKPSNVEVEKQLKDSKKKLDREIKLLLLGSGESGKSTIFKQIKIFRKNGFNDEESKRSRALIFGSIALSISKLVKGCIKHDWQIAEDNQRQADVMRDINESSTLSEEFEQTFLKELSGPVRDLWVDEAVQKAFAVKKEFHIDDGFEHFMSKFDQIVQPGYIPSQDDLLFLRVKTVGIVEMDFEVKGSNIRVIDVGGQRTERRKWIHHFDSVTAVLFVTATSDYDQLCYEDNATNRMKESIQLFESVANNPYFVKTPIILFLNKIDLLKKKLPVSA